MKKIGIIYSGNNGVWVSVEQIRSNLAKAYYKYFKNCQITIYDYTLNTSLKDITTIAKKIKNDNVEILIFIEDYPYPSILTKILLGKYPTFSPLLVYHIYGSFSIQASEWYLLNKYIKNRKVILICSSHAHQRLINSFLTNKNTTHYCPHPIDKKVFSFNKNKVLSSRKKYDIKSNDFLFIYSGRLSLQKNILLMCKEILNLKKSFNKNIKIILAGNFDDHGAKFFNIEPPLGYYYQTWLDFFETLETTEQNSIKHVGFLSKQELNTLFHASDCYINLSTFHSENYGVAPAEALCCGLQAVLTKWGGFSSFQEDNRYCKYANVDIGQNGIEISKQSLRSSLKQAVNNKLSIEKKEHISEVYRKSLSIDAAGHYLEEIFSSDIKNFNGFTDKLKLFSNDLNKGFPPPSPTGTYFRAYKNYLSK